jgi:glutamyl-tRNA synthetase
MISLARCVTVGVLCSHDEEAARAIIAGMEWLGVKHDGEIVRQSANKERHKAVAAQMLENGKAFKCYCSKDQLEALRAEAEKNKVPFRYPGTCCAPGFVPPAGVDPVVRINTEKEGSTGWDDQVQGRIDFPNKDVDDFIILRADGSPTYLLAVVVDDHDMEISHVIRGSDHISNTPRQLQIYKACGWTPPDFGHIPLIHGPDGQKLSKRHGATGVEQYEALGYLPEAMRNYLSRLSWAHGNDEIFSTEQAIEWFTLEGCSKSASCFDYDKLKDLNAHYIKECDNERLRNLAIKLYPELAPFQKQVWCGARPFGAASAMRTPLHQSRTPLTRGTHTHAHSTTRPRRTPAQAAGHSGVRLN